MRRREFLIGSAMAAGMAGRGSAQSVSQAKLDRVAIMTYSFDRIVKDPAHPGDTARTLEILDTPEMFADRFHVHNVEVQHTHFASTESSYLKEFREKLKKAKSRMTNICLEFESLNISSPDPMLRVETIDITRRWIDHAAELGCPRVMVNQGNLAPEVRQAAIETLKTIGDYGKAKKIGVTMENRGGGGGRGAPNAPARPAGGRPGGATWEVVVEVLKASGTYSNPDIGNFPDDEARMNGLRVMYPMSHGNSHVKLNPDRYDLAKALAVSKDVGYKGLYSIEAGGNGGRDPYDAVQKIYDVLIANI
jgi:Xylose isomerase-like TIM barrel